MGDCRQIHKPSTMDWTSLSTTTNWPQRQPYTGQTGFTNSEVQTREEQVARYMSYKREKLQDEDRKLRDSISTSNGSMRASQTTSESYNWTQGYHHTSLETASSSSEWSLRLSAKEHLDGLAGYKHCSPNLKSTPYLNYPQHHFDPHSFSTSSVYHHHHHDLHHYHHHASLLTAHHHPSPLVDQSALARPFGGTNPMFYYPNSPFQVSPANQLFHSGYSDDATLQKHFYSKGWPPFLESITFCCGNVLLAS